MRSQHVILTLSIMVLLCAGCPGDGTSGPAGVQPTPTPKATPKLTAQYEVDRLIFEDKFTDPSPWTAVTALTCYQEGACEWEPSQTTGTPDFSGIEVDDSGPLYRLASYCQAEPEPSSGSDVFGEMMSEEAMRELPNIPKSFDLGKMSRITFELTSLFFDRGSFDASFIINGRSVEIRFKKESDDDKAVSVESLDEESGDLRYGGIEISFDVIDNEATQTVKVLGEAASAVPYNFEISNDDSDPENTLRLNGQSQCYDVNGETQGDSQVVVLNSVRIYQLKLTE